MLKESKALDGRSINKGVGGVLESIEQIFQSSGSAGFVFLFFVVFFLSG